ncbi:hypothetical protein [Kitasatospora sp. NPDC004531]
MICPHCQNDLLQRRRTGHTCADCGKTFALDPKVEPGRLHDTKFRTLVAKGRGDRRLQITVEQLYWLNERRLHRFPRAEEYAGSVLVGVTQAVLAVADLSIALAIGSFAWILLGPIGVVFALLAVKNFVGSKRLKSESPLRPQVSPNDFQQRVVDRWQRVYRELPAGLTEHPPSASKPSKADARAVVLCEVPAVLAFLRANDFAERHQVLLATELAQVTNGLPVVVLRDLSLKALSRTVWLRSQLPGRRVVDAGLLPRTVFAPARAVRLRDHAGPRPTPAALAASAGWQRLSEQEREWLLGGWSCPLITLPPPKLYALAEKAVERALAAPAADRGAAGPGVAAPAAETPEQTRRRAERVGFLTWPSAPPADGAR